MVYFLYLFPIFIYCGLDGMFVGYFPIKTIQHGLFFTRSNIHPLKTEARFDKANHFLFFIHRYILP